MRLHDMAIPLLTPHTMAADVVYLPSREVGQELLSSMQFQCGTPTEALLATLEQSVTLFGLGIILLDLQEMRIEWLMGAQVNTQVPSEQFTSLLFNLHPEDRESLIAYVRQARLNLQQPSKKIFRIAHSSGHWLYFLVLGTPLRKKGGESMTHLLAAVTNIADILEQPNLMKPLEDEYRNLNLRILVQKLTSREFDVLEQIAQAKTDQEIADVLHISVAAVRWHNRQLLKKMQARNRVELARIAWRHGLM